MTKPFNGFKPYEYINPDGKFPALLVCDHAVNTIPAELNNLGLEQCELDRHIAWDPGARGVTLELAERLDAPALMAGYSRLVIDPNRSPDSETSILEDSDGTVIPGNLGLDPQARSDRIASCFKPYHDAIEAVLDQPCSNVRALLCVHSFTPALNGDSVVRPWHASVLWGGRQQQFAQRVRTSIARLTDLEIGDNVPYAQTPEFGYTADAHGEARGLPNLLIEIRHDLLKSPESQRTWAGCLAEVFAEVLASEPLAGTHVMPLR